MDWGLILTGWVNLFCSMWDLGVTFIHFWWVKLDKNSNIIWQLDNVVGRHRCLLLGIGQLSKIRSDLGVDVYSKNNIMKENRVGEWRFNAVSATEATSRREKTEKWRISEGILWLVSLVRSPGMYDIKTLTRVRPPLGRAVRKHYGKASSFWHRWCVRSDCIGTEVCR